MEEIFVNSGDQVDEGKQLMRFSNTSLESEVIRNETSVIEQINGLRTTEISLKDSQLAAKARLAEVEYQIKKLTKQAERQKFFFARGVTTVEARDVVLDELSYLMTIHPTVIEQNRIQIAYRKDREPQLHDTIKKLERDLITTRQRLHSLTVRAPAAGRVTDFDAQIGQTMLRGQRLAVLALDTGFRLAADVDEFYLSRVAVGQKVTIDSFGTAIPMTVQRVQAKVDKGMFKVFVTFDESPPRGLLAGQALQGTLQLSDDQPALWIPNGPFFDKTGGNWIFVLSPDGETAIRRTIKIGRQNAKQLEVLSGLLPNERVVISDYTGYDNIQRIVLKN